MSEGHIPVLLKECLSGLNVKDGGVYFDGTLGGGGHSIEILKSSAPNGKLIATDLDEWAIEKADGFLSDYKGRYTLVHDNYKNFAQIVRDLNIEGGFDGILLDLGVSSFQIDNRERGFSYIADAPLDMRMDQGGYLTAEIVVNEYDENKLAKVLWDYGEERFSRRIAANIVAYRKEKRITRSGELVGIIEKSIPKRLQMTGGHPAKRTFQALRIEVNGELEGLYEAVIDMVHGLKKGGRIAIITFHSLEDRIVKNAYKYLELDCICDKSLPICVCDKKQEIEILTRKPITATEEECTFNPRSKSAKLRIAEKIIE